MAVRTKKRQGVKAEAMGCLKNGNFQKARDLLEQVCRLGLKDADVWLLLGVIYGQGGQIHKAIQRS